MYVENWLNLNSFDNVKLRKPIFKIKVLPLDIIKDSRAPY